MMPFRAVYYDDQLGIPQEGVARYASALSQKGLLEISLAPPATRRRIGA